MKAAVEHGAGASADIDSQLGLAEDDDPAV